MTDKRKCDKYEAYFVFKDDKAFNEHLKNCPDCREEHAKYLKVSNLVKEVAPVYLAKRNKRKIDAVKKLACCFIFLAGFSVYSGYQLYGDYTFQVNSADESYISSSLGLPVDEYGFLEI